MKFFPALVVLAVAFAAGGCGKSDHAEPAASDNLVAAPVKYIGAAVTNQQIAVKAIDLVSLNQEVQLFNVQEGRYPKSLDELVAKRYVGQLPIPPFGTKIVYDAVQGKVTLVQP